MNPEKTCRYSFDGNKIPWPFPDFFSSAIKCPDFSRFPEIPGPLVTLVYTVAKKISDTFWTEASDDWKFRLSWGKFIAISFRAFYDVYAVYRQQKEEYIHFYGIWWLKVTIKVTIKSMVLSRRKKLTRLGIRFVWTIMKVF